METKTEIYGYEIQFNNCPLCSKYIDVSAFSVKSEKKAVTIFIQLMKTHLNKNCESYHGQKVGLNVKLKQNIRTIATRIITYETKKVDRKIIV